MTDVLLAAATRLLWVVVGELADEIQAFIRRYLRQRADNEKLGQMVGSMVREVAGRWDDFADWKEALGYASDRVMDWAKELGMDVERSIVNTRIELKIDAYREKGILK